MYNKHNSLTSRYKMNVYMHLKSSKIYKFISSVIWWSSFSLYQNKCFKGALTNEKLIGISVVNVNVTIFEEN